MSSLHPPRGEELQQSRANILSSSVDIACKVSKSFLTRSVRTTKMSNQSIRIMALGPVPPPYHGVATFLRDLLNQEEDSQIKLLHLDTSDARDASNLGRWDVTNIQLGIRQLAQLAAVCMRTDIDIVYLPVSQNVPAFLRDALFIIQSRLLGKRVLIHLHGGYFRKLYENEGGGFFRLIVRAAMCCVSGAVVLGEEFRGIFAGLVPPERVFVVENGVPDPGAWELRARSQKVPGETLLYMSTLTQTKGILELLQAVSFLRQAYPAIRLIVAGQWAEDSLRSKAEVLIEREQIQPNVTFVGHVSGTAKAEFLSAGDIFCLPTHYPYEGQPLVILEAMAAGLPVLSTRHGVIGSTVLAGNTGWLLPKDATAEMLADALRQMLSDKKQLIEFGRNARQRYLDCYTLEACHRRLFQVFHSTYGCR